MGRETGIDALARASDRVAVATRGRLFRFRERKGKALGVPLKIGSNPKIKAPLHGATPVNGLRADVWASGCSQGEKQESLRVR